MNNDPFPGAHRRSAFALAGAMTAFAVLGTVLRLFDSVVPEPARLAAVATPAAAAAPTAVAAAVAGCVETLGGSSIGRACAGQPLHSPF